MSGLLKNISASFLGQGWVALMGVCFVPVYLKFIGVDGYGLVGFFLILSSALTLLDGGFGAAATREASIYGASNDEDKLRIVRVLRSTEVIFWGAAIFCGLMIFFLAPFIVSHWLSVEAEKNESITSVIRIMAGAILLQFPVPFYYGCLLGLQRQVLLNIYSSIFATVRSGGAALVLWLVSPTVESFFVWQCIASLITLFVVRVGVVRLLPEWGRSSIFSVEALKQLGQFATGVGVSNVLSFALMQVDKIILSKLLSLKDFGYYMLAWTVGTIAFRLMSPIFNSYYPKMASYVALGEYDEVARLLLRGSQLLSMLVVPISLWIAIYSPDLLLFWTRDNSVSEVAAGPLSLIALGTMFYSFMHIPYALQLAYARSRFSVLQNVASLVFMAPLTYFLLQAHGLQGSGWPWLLMNAACVMIALPIVFKCLEITPGRWYLHAVVWPCFIAFVVLWVGSILIVPLGAYKFFLGMVFLGLSYILVASRFLVLSLDWKKIRWREIY
ncbi:membrane protein involved in the export of O-antigen and teichoic acid [Pseudomonas asplenii]|uniref:Membrane protein involved in the export of O-antigen and teichoic acid n=1 Tax=Pseudomonas asplenii TaxID=53407 RepID=A0A0N0E223_9PSED|nr:oligosaccharide flippase family protein [Pseudomonas fuscovaginae]KPA88388.1 membrane protein involved in the export of O-antigen and teichoic acid [Pseudomonas fuscovaginae]